MIASRKPNFGHAIDWLYAYRHSLATSGFVSFLWAGYTTIILNETDPNDIFIVLFFILAYTIPVSLLIAYTFRIKKPRYHAGVISAWYRSGRYAIIVAGHEAASEAVTFFERSNITYDWKAHSNETLYAVCFIFTYRDDLVLARMGLRNIVALDSGGGFVAST